jgi:O-antigen/teichoic acid export membrane protein
LSSLTTIRQISNKYKDTRFLAQKHKKFLIFTSLSDLLNIFLVQLPILILTRLTSAIPTGQFAFSNRLLGLPIMFISSSVGEVFKQKASDEYRRTKKCQNTFIQTFKGLFIFSIIPFIFLFIFAPEIFAFVFGEEWRDAGIYTRIMSPMFFLKFTVSPLTYIYYINGRQKEDFILHLIMFLLVVGSLYLGYEQFQTVNMMLFCYSLCFSLIYIYYLSRSYVLSKKENLSRLK